MCSFYRDQSSINTASVRILHSALIMIVMTDKEEMHWKIWNIYLNILTFHIKTVPYRPIINYEHNYNEDISFYTNK
jgi:hypothetical protein